MPSKTPNPRASIRCTVMSVWAASDSHAIAAMQAASSSEAVLGADSGGSLTPVAADSACDRGLVSKCSDMRRSYTRRERFAAGCTAESRGLEQLGAFPPGFLALH